jgi:hypothetical protein
MGAQKLGMRKRVARMIRRVKNARWMPDRAEVPLRRVAHWFSPHEYRCGLCGAEFTAESGRSLRHAERAWEHYVDVHESIRSEVCRG